MSTTKQPEMGSSLGKDARRRLFQNKSAFLSIIILMGMFIACFILPLTGWIAPPNDQNILRIAEPPSFEHFLGTDHLGRDLLSRILYGGRISLLVGIVATGVSLIIGLIYGSISGYAGKRIDALLMRTVDILFALPFIVLVIIFSLSIEPISASITDWVTNTTGFSYESVSPITNLVPLFIAIGALGWLTLARIVRTEVLSLKNQDYILAARSLGLSSWAIITRHIIPNLIGPVIVYTTLSVPGIMLLEAVLSFLGLGVRAPNSSWGTLIKEGADRMEVTYGLLLYPALFFSLTLLALNFLGDGLRDALDPKSETKN